MPQGHHFVEDAAERPDVRLLIVGFLLADLGREVVGRANSCLRTVVRVLEHSGNAEVANLDLTALSHENILRLKVAM